MSSNHIWFCKTCSAVLGCRVDYCPHCGGTQYYDIKCTNCNFETSNENMVDCPECNFSLRFEEDDIRSCPYCGKNLDIEGRNLDRRYCDDPDCQKEIGGLIRYSDKTGDSLSLEQILLYNDYEKELKDWLKNIHNNAYHTYFSTYYKRLLYIYNESGEYTGNDFAQNYQPIFDDMFIHYISDLDKLTDDINIDTLLTISKREGASRKKHCLCAIDLNPYDKKTEAHEVIGEYIYDDDYIPDGENDYFKTFKNISTTFIFTSSYLPEETKLYDIYSKFLLIVSPEILKSVDLGKLWQEVKKEAK